MKPDIHPEYQPATITCACGASFETRSTGGSFAVDVCSSCHPFYTGRQKIMDTAGRVERFKKKYAKAAQKAKGKKAEEAPAAEESATTETKSE